MFSRFWFLANILWLIIFYDFWKLSENFHAEFAVENKNKSLANFPIKFYKYVKKLILNSIIISVESTTHSVSLLPREEWMKQTINEA
jgi:hypothetical protein